MESIHTDRRKERDMKFNLTITVDVDEKKFFTNPDNGNDFYVYSDTQNGEILQDLTLQEIVKSTVATDVLFPFTSNFRGGGVLRDATVSFKSRGLEHKWYLEINPD
jgi:hypothetical protein